MNNVSLDSTSIYVLKNNCRKTQYFSTIFSKISRRVSFSRLVNVNLMQKVFTLTSAFQSHRKKIPNKNEKTTNSIKPLANKDLIFMKSHISRPFLWIVVVNIALQFLKIVKINTIQSHTIHTAIIFLCFSKKFNFLFEKVNFFVK